jgi:tyrosinase
VHIFLGDFDSNLNTWNTQHALVGTFSVFGRNTTPGSSEETGCGKCKKDAEDGLVVTGTIPLTKALINEVNEGHCPSLAKENVLPWLQENLHWRVTLADGTEKDRSEVPGLVVTVVTTEVELPPHGFPRFSGIYTSHPEVTAGRPAGVEAPAATA